MKLISNDKQQWYIHFFSDVYSMSLYENYNSIKELCDNMNIKRSDFEIYKNTK